MMKRFPLPKKIACLIALVGCLLVGAGDSHAGGQLQWWFTDVLGNWSATSLKWNTDAMPDNGLRWSLYQPSQIDDVFPIPAMHDTIASVAELYEATRRSLDAWDDGPNIDFKMNDSVLPSYIWNGFFPNQPFATPSDVEADGFNLITWQSANLDNILAGGVLGVTSVMVFTADYEVRNGFEVPTATAMSMIWVIVDLDGDGFLDAWIPPDDYEAGNIFDADIAMGSYYAGWVDLPEDPDDLTVPRDAVLGVVDIQAVLTHELGHAIGLGHTEIYDATMYPFYFVGFGSITDPYNVREPAIDDFSTMNCLYPDGTGGVMAGSVIDGDGFPDDPVNYIPVHIGRPYDGPYDPLNPGQTPDVLVADDTDLGTDTLIRLFAMGFTSTDIVLSNINDPFSYPVDYESKFYVPNLPNGDFYVHINMQNPNVAVSEVQDYFWTYAPEFLPEEWWDWQESNLDIDTSATLLDGLRRDIFLLTNEGATTECGRLPYVPSNPDPENSTNTVHMSAMLDWDLDPCVYNYNIYFGTSSPPPYYSNTTTMPIPVDAGRLEESTTYYWQIVAGNQLGQTEGPIWNFTTIACSETTPARASMPSPPDGAQGVDIDQNLEWTSGTCATMHDLYFGLTDPPQFITRLTTTGFEQGPMPYDTTFFWRVDSVNEKGFTTGTVWSFRTTSDTRFQNQFTFFDETEARMPLQPLNGTEVVVIDIDNDMDLDMVVGTGFLNAVQPNPQYDRIYLNDGAGNFTDVTFGDDGVLNTGDDRWLSMDGIPGLYGLSTMQLLPADFDNDNDMDLLALYYPELDTFGSITETYNHSRPRLWVNQTVPSSGKPSRPGYFLDETQQMVGATSGGVPIQFERLPNPLWNHILFQAPSTDANNDYTWPGLALSDVGDIDSDGDIDIVYGINGGIWALANHSFFSWQHNWNQNKVIYRILAERYGRAYAIGDDPLPHGDEYTTEITTFQYGMMIHTNHVNQRFLAEARFGATVGADGFFFVDDTLGVDNMLTSYWLRAIRRDEQPGARPFIGPTGFDSLTFDRVPPVHLETVQVNTNTGAVTFYNQFHFNNSGQVILAPIMNQASLDIYVAQRNGTIGSTSGYGQGWDGIYSQNLYSVSSSHGGDVSNTIGHNLTYQNMDVDADGISDGYFRCLNYGNDYLGADDVGDRWGFLLIGTNLAGANVMPSQQLNTWRAIVDDFDYTGAPELLALSNPGYNLFNYSYSGNPRPQMFTRVGFAGGAITGAGLNFSNSDSPFEFVLSGGQQGTIVQPANRTQDVPNDVNDTMVWDAAVCDVNMDGWMDVGTAEFKNQRGGFWNRQPRPDNLYINDERGAFATVSNAISNNVPSFTMGLAYADVDLDGDPDMISTGLADSPTLRPTSRLRISTRLSTETRYLRMKTASDSPLFVDSSELYIHPLVQHYDVGDGSTRETLFLDLDNDDDPDILNASFGGMTFLQRLTANSFAFQNMRFDRVPTGDRNDSSNPNPYRIATHGLNLKPNVRFFKPFQAEYPTPILISPEASGAGRYLGHTTHATDIEAIDYDNDGDMDAVRSDTSFRNWLIVNHSGTITPGFIHPVSDEFFMAGSIASTIASLPEDPLNYSPYESTQGVAVGDLDADGYDDIFFCNGIQSWGAENLLLMNNAPLATPDQYTNAFWERTINFYRTLTPSGRAKVDDSVDAIVADFTHDDGIPGADIFVINREGYLGDQAPEQFVPHFRFYHNTGSADPFAGRVAEETWRLAGADPASTTTYQGIPTGITAADLDNDGDLDAFVTMHDQGDMLFLNDGSGHFTEVGGFSLIGMSSAQRSYDADIADFNGDGWPDIAVARFVSVNDATVLGTSLIQLYLNLGPEGYTDPVKFLDVSHEIPPVFIEDIPPGSEGWIGRDVDFVDVDVDGDFDLHLSVEGVNEYTPESDWINFMYTNMLSPLNTSVETTPSVAGMPTLYLVTPNILNKDETVDVTLKGLDFVEGMSVNFGQGITVGNVSLISDREAAATVTVSHGTPAGYRHVALTAPDGRQVHARVYIMPNEADAPEPPVTFNFDYVTNGWEYISPPGFTHPVGFHTSGSLFITGSGDPAHTDFGFWQSQGNAIELQPDSFYRLETRVETNVPQTVCPSLRVRANSFDGQQADTFWVNSSYGGEFSPSAAGSLYRFFLMPPETASHMGLAVDMVNFTPDDSTTATIKIDYFSVQRYDDTKLTGRQEILSSSFETGTDGWEGGGATGFTLPGFSVNNGSLIMRANNNIDTFGYWAGPDDLLVLNDVSRLYVAEFTVGADTVSAADTPIIRLRLNTQNGHGVFVKEIISTGAADNSPFAGASKTYRVLMSPSYSSHGFRFAPAIDVVNFGGMDAPSARIMLEEFNIHSYDLPLTP